MTRGVLIVACGALVCAAPVLGQDQPAAPPPPEAPAPEAPPPQKTWLEGWERSVDLGINGASGNTENFNFRTRLGLNRKTEATDTKIHFLYILESQDGDNSENRGEFFARNDWLFKDSPWLIFAQGLLEYDEFEAWDWRLTLAGGLGYRFIDTEKDTLIGRVGLAVRREWGGPDDDWHPEALFGGDYEHRFAKHHKLFATGDFFLALDDDYPDYRFIVKAGYEILLSEKSKMTLKLGIEDEYDQSPGAGFRRNDFRYFATLGWVF